MRRRDWFTAAFLACAVIGVLQREARAQEVPYTYLRLEVEQVCTGGTPETGLWGTGDATENGVRLNSESMSCDLGTVPEHGVITVYGYGHDAEPGLFSSRQTLVFPSGVGIAREFYGGGPETVFFRTGPEQGSLAGPQVATITAEDGIADFGYITITTGTEPAPPTDPPPTDPPPTSPGVAGTVTISALEGDALVLFTVVSSLALFGSAAGVVGLVRR